MFFWLGLLLGLPKRYYIGGSRLGVWRVASLGGVSALGFGAPSSGFQGLGFRVYSLQGLAWGSPMAALVRKNWCSLMDTYRQLYSNIENLYTKNALLPKRYRLRSPSGGMFSLSPNASNA